MVTDTDTEELGTLPAVIWCQVCPEPATGPDEFCTPHREGVPASIVDPWLAADYLRGLRKRGAITEGPHCASCTATVWRFRGDAYLTMAGAVAARKEVKA